MTVRKIFNEMLLSDTDAIARVLSVGVSGGASKDEKLAAILAEVVLGYARDVRLKEPGIAFTEAEEEADKRGEPIPTEKLEEMADVAIGNRKYWNGYRDLAHIDVLMNMLYDYGDDYTKEA